MTSSRPYLIRALYAWISDNGLTPHILVDARREGVEVPAEQVRDGRIVLNIDASAVRDLALENDWIAFRARFGGVAREVRLPTGAVMVIYARENGQGMAFGDEQDRGPPPPAPEPERRPSLKVIK